MDYKSEVKKLLYREKPKAVLSIRGEKLLYKANTSKGKVYFKVPENEAFGFEEEMEAHLLIRWMDWVGEVVSTLDKESVSPSNIVLDEVGSYTSKEGAANMELAKEFYRQQTKELMFATNKNKKTKQ